MGLDKPPITAPALTDLIDADGLRRDLTALAQTVPNSSALRKEGLTLIKAAFIEGREKVKVAVQSGGLEGQGAARLLSALQDTIIQVIYDFAVKHVYYAQNP